MLENTSAASAKDAKEAEADRSLSPELINQDKIVYTVRSWKGYKESSKVEVDGVGSCTKKRVLRVTKKDDLARYLSLSGFDSIDNWWTKICCFGACDGWLFEVRAIPASPESEP